MSDGEQTEFKNDNLTVHIAREPGAVVKFTIHVSPLATKAAYQKALKNVNKEVVLPGFRKGKAPEKFILEKYSKYVHDEQKEILINTGLQEALQLTKIFPFNKESVKLLKAPSISNEKGSEFAIQFEANPVVPHIDPQEISLKSTPQKAITDKDVDDAIQEVRLYHAEWKEVSDRPVQEGDFVNLDIDSLEEGGGELCKDTRFEVKEGKMGTWMRNVLIGQQVQNSVEGVSEEEPETCASCGTEGHEHHHHHHNPDFKPTKCKITIKTIFETKLPELDDLLAKKVGLKEIGDLRPRVKEDLERQSREAARSYLRRQLRQKLLDKYPFDLPASLIEGNKELIEYQVAERLKQLQQSDAKEEEIESHRQELENAVKKDLEDSYRFSLIEQKIAREQNFQVAQDELMRELMRQTYMGQEESIINTKMEPEEIRQRLTSYILTRKASDYLLDHAHIE